MNTTQYFKKKSFKLFRKPAQLSSVFHPQEVLVQGGNRLPCSSTSSCHTLFQELERRLNCIISALCTGTNFPPSGRKIWARPGLSCLLFAPFFLSCLLCAPETELNVYSATDGSLAGFGEGTFQKGQFCECELKSIIWIHLDDRAFLKTIFLHNLRLWNYKDCLKRVQMSTFFFLFSLWDFLFKLP